MILMLAVAMYLYLKKLKMLTLMKRKKTLFVIKGLEYKFTTNPKMGLKLKFEMNYLLLIQVLIFNKDLDLLRLVRLLFEFFDWVTLK
jgi:hypothetical protein